MHPRIQELLGYVDECRADFRAAFEAVPTSLREKRPAVGQWSVADVVQHVAIVKSRVTHLLRVRLAGAIAENLGPETDDSPILPRLAISRVLDRSHKVMTDNASMPKQSLGAHEAWTVLESADAAFRDAVVACEGLAIGGITFPHIALGPLTLYEWIAFVGAHERRHAGQMSETATALGAV